MAKLSELVAQVTELEAAGDMAGAAALRQRVETAGYGDRLPPPVVDIPPTPEPDSFLDNALDVAGEFSAGANRAAMDTLDFLGPGTINAGLRLFGQGEHQLPTFGGMHGATPGAEGGFMEEGMARDAVSAAGATLPAAAGFVPATGRNLATGGGIVAEMAGLGSAEASGAQNMARHTAGALADASETVAPMVGRADDLGWPLTPGDRHDNRALKWIDSAIESFPMVGNPIHRINDKRQAILNQTAAGSIGLPPGTQLTDDAIGGVADELGGVFKSLETDGPLPSTDEFAQTLVDVQDSAKTRLFSDPVIGETVDSVFDKLDESGNLAAIDYQDMTSELKAKIRSAWNGESPDPQFADSLSDIVEALDDLAADNMDPQALATLREARRRWKALTILEKSRAVKESGDVSGPLAANYLRRTDKGGYGRGGNKTPFYEAARMSKAFPSRPDSGTAGRMLLQNMVSNPVGAALGAAASPITSTLANLYTGGAGGAARLARILEMPAGQRGVSVVGRGTGGLLED